MPDARRLAGRRIVITGASSGIGLATAQLFAAEGATLTLFDISEKLLVVAQALGARATLLDVSSESAVNEAVDAAASDMGGLDGLVNAAGIFPVAKLEETSLELWRKTLDINLTGPFLVCRAAAKHLRVSEGATIVNLSSGSALLPYPDLSAYGASKGGIITFIKVLAAELTPSVRVNVVCPGMTRTGMVTSWHPDEAKLAEQARKVYALQRIAEPDEIARAILFFTSSESSILTGTVFAADGGRTFH